MKTPALFIYIFVLLTACQKESEIDLKEADYIVFGHFYGFCQGEECIEMFKLTGNALYEDTRDTYPRWDRYYEGSFVKLEDDKFEQVKSLKEFIPDQLHSSKDTIFGLPDAADGGGIYFAISDGENLKYWVIDQVDQNIPEYLRPFKAEINHKIQLINN